MKNMKNNKIMASIIMAEYNTPADQFNECIDSIIKQTYRDFELIIINDQSKTDIARIVHAKNDARIRIINNETNLGLAKSLNKALQLCKSDIIIRMDTDDIMVKDRLERQISFYEEHSYYSIIGGGYYIFDGKDNKKAKIKVGEIKKKDFLYNTPFAHPTLLIRKKDLISIGGYPDYRRGQDYAMEMNMYANGYLGYNMEEPLIYYRQDKDGYKKKNYASRVLEYRIRKKYFRSLGFPIWRIVYAVKPLIVGLLPKQILKRVQKR